MLCFIDRHCSYTRDNPTQDYTWRSAQASALTQVYRGEKNLSLVCSVFAVLTISAISAVVAAV